MGPHCIAAQNKDIGIGLVTRLITFRTQPMSIFEPRSQLALQILTNISELHHAELVNVDDNVLQLFTFQLPLYLLDWAESRKPSFTSSKSYITLRDWETYPSLSETVLLEKKKKTINLSLSGTLGIVILHQVSHHVKFAVQWADSIHVYLCLSFQALHQLKQTEYRSTSPERPVQSMLSPYVHYCRLWTIWLRYNCSLALYIVVHLMT